MLLQDYINEINTLPDMVNPEHQQKSTKKSGRAHHIRVRHSLKALEDLRSCLEDYGIGSPATQFTAELKDSLHSLAHIVHFNPSLVGKIIG